MSLYVSLAFKLYGDDKLVSFTNTIHQRMSVDTQYTSLLPFVEDVKAQNDAFILSISNAKQGGMKLTELKNACREALLVILCKVAKRLEIKTEDNKDDATIITDAGFEVRNTTQKTRETVKVLDAPVLEAENIKNKTGSARIKWKSVPKAINYGIRLKKQSETDWQNGNFTNKKEFIFTNLEPNTVYDFQIYAQGSDGVSSDMSAVVTIYVS